ncbi:YggT family protein [Roseospirillum parvum]|uniref:YggT family protein n=1 Tax=Roseospirillum parvum TaxID=83401 RepID=A0A1G7XV24_9PROT|nr:YggT family protein [Roseospirillum parvum]SDG88004.1 YggT family protein [Roseospirillum parvum]
MDIVVGPLFMVLDIALNLLMWAVIISAILSWLVAFNVINPRNQFVASVGNVLWRITEPLLRPIRRVVPVMGGVDLSPIVLLLAIVFVRGILANIHYAMM